ncbi:MAG: sugar phosphate isomerase/epimerase [Planctomycetaceae bacterium]|nr:sugar phosphate isomerase/epimerase [Planctomycetaceae bacterium]
MQSERPSLRRRRFLAAAAAGTLLPVVGRTTCRGEVSDTKREICVFTKALQTMPWDRMAQQLADWKVAGAEAPVRVGGHIEPHEVPDRLPQFAEVLRSRGLVITVLTSDVNDPNDPLTETVLRTAAGLGIRYYRMKYFKYDESRPVMQQITEWQSALKDLAALNQELGITAVYQNHAGRNYFGAALWDLHRALEHIDPQHIGAAYDIRHATVEAGMSWPISFRLIRPHIRVVYVKDFRWNEGQPENVPLGQGHVQRGFFRLLQESGFQGPVSLHEEYVDHRDPSLIPQHTEAITADLATLREWLDGEQR